MKNIILLIILFVTTLNIIKAQTETDYNSLVNEGVTLYQSKNYTESAKKYTKAFRTLGGYGNLDDRYNAACSWALANEPDSAFYQLFRIAELGNYSDFDHISTDSDLNSLHSNERWNELITLIKSNKDKIEADFDKHIVAILDTIYEDDQKYRQQMRDIQNEFGWRSDTMQNLLKKIDYVDSVNLVKVKKILDEKGWLGPKVVGDRGNGTLFLVIQHADLTTQEKYLPMMKEAVQNGNARSTSLALLEDRVLIGQGNEQLYGSQIGRDEKSGEYYVLPLADPDNVDVRRAEVGLRPLNDYLSHWKLTWDAEAYKQKLPEYKAKLTDRNR